MRDFTALAASALADRRVALLALLLSALCVYSVCTRDRIQIDEAEFAHVAWNLAVNDLRPFEDFFEHHCPGWWEVLGVAYWAGEQGLGVIAWGRVLLGLSVALQMWAVYRVVAAAGGALPAVAAAVWGGVEIISVRPEAASTPLQMWALVALLAYVRGRRLAHLAACAGCLALAAYFSPRVAWSALAFGALLVHMAARRRAPVGHLAAFAAVASLGLAAVCLRVGFDNFYTWIFLYSSSAHPAFSPWPGFLGQSGFPITAMGWLCAALTLARACAAWARGRGADLVADEHKAIALLAMASGGGLLCEPHSYSQSQIMLRATCLVALFTLGRAWFDRPVFWGATLAALALWQFNYGPEARALSQQFLRACCLAAAAAVAAARLTAWGRPALPAASLAAVLVAAVYLHNLAGKLTQGDMLAADLQRRSELLADIPPGRTMALFPGDARYPVVAAGATYFWFYTRDTYETLVKAGITTDRADFVGELSRNMPYFVSGAAKGHFDRWARILDRERGGGDHSARLAAWWSQYAPAAYEGIWVHEPGRAQAATASRAPGGSGAARR